ncbi:hypothetical protein G3570_10860 [Balneolaceae bacterium YR4-1]|uniref:Transposase n=1 Tax=Halalkalibaculum roseum TaxID=2709311 RepID=A0A6M1SYY2_9BACT|nr:hypothetical protein [Halalkalibaculum roseum]NGP77136.1 hypothetical protein [Halalkalibaculum roseum]
MANEEQNYTSEFKTKVATKALEQDKQNLDRLSDKYEVPVSQILKWTVQLEKEGADAFKEEVQPESSDSESHIEDHESVDVEVDNPDIAESISFGVMHDDLNYKRLIFWSVLGMILVAIFVKGLVEMYQYNTTVSRDRISEESQYYQIKQLNEEAQETLNSFGVVDPEAGIYRIPIDSAMNDIANSNDN